MLKPRSSLLAPSIVARVARLSAERWLRGAPPPTPLAPSPELIFAPGEAPA